MVKQPDRESRNVNDAFYKSEEQRINELNDRFFSNVELTDAENKVLVWLCGWDDFTINNVMSAFSKMVKDILANM